MLRQYQSLGPTIKENANDTKERVQEFNSKL